MALEKLSLNQRTTKSWTVPQVIAGCVAEGIPAVGLWRGPVTDYGLEETARAVAAAGLRVSSLCRGGFLTTAQPAERVEAIQDNVRAIEEAAQLGADCLVMVVGGLPPGDRDLAGARERVVECIGMLVGHAAKNGVQLALEPMHPMYCADRGVLSTLEQAVTMAEQFRPEEVGVVVDTFHVWWDPKVFEQIARATDRILSFQVSDWITPMPSDPLLARGLMGDGHIDFPSFLQAVRATGYSGDIEVEIFNADLWAMDPAVLLSQVVDRYIDCGLSSEA